MYSKTMCTMLSQSFQIARYVGAGCLVFDINTKETTVDQDSRRKMKRNFCLAVIWQGLAFLLVVSRSKNLESSGEFHLTLAWWIGFLTLLVIYSFMRYFSSEICDTLNGLGNLLREIHGKVFYITNLS